MRSAVERGRRRRLELLLRVCRARGHAPLALARAPARDYHPQRPLREERGRRTSRLGMTSPSKLKMTGKKSVRRIEERGIAPDSGNKTSFSGTRTAQCSNVNRWRYLRAEEKFQLNVAQSKVLGVGLPRGELDLLAPSTGRGRASRTAKINSSARGRTFLVGAHERAPRARYKGLCALARSRFASRSRRMERQIHGLGTRDGRAEKVKQAGGRGNRDPFSAILP